MSVGGRGGGGASLTTFGAELVAAYRAFESHIRKRAQSAFPATALPAPANSTARKALGKRRLTKPKR